MLLAGISSLLVGAPMWWLAWKPAQRTASSESSPARRVYLIAVFGLSAVSALITLLVLGYRLFEFALAQDAGVALVDRVRTPLGLFVATALAAAYHFSVWRHDRAVWAALPGQQRSISQVILVASGDGLALKRLIEGRTGATVKLWLRETTEDEAPTSPSGAAQGMYEPGPALDLLVDALKDVTSKRVLVVTGLGSAVEVIPLMD